MVKYLLKEALTDEISNREIYMKGIDTSCYYEGYTIYKTGELLTRSNEFLVEEDLVSPFHFIGLVILICEQYMLRFQTIV